MSAVGTIEVISSVPGPRVYAEYRTKPKNVKWYNIVPTIAESNLQKMFGDIAKSYDIDTNVEEQLNIIGRVVVQSRVVAFPVSVDPEEFGDTDVEFGDEVLAEFGGLTFTNSVTLTDEEYRPFLKSKIQRNNTSATIDEIMTAVNTTLSNAKVEKLIDNEDMTFSLVLSGSLTATEVSLLASANFVPRPQCVGYLGHVLDIVGTINTSGADAIMSAIGSVVFEHNNLGVFSVVGDYIAAGGGSPLGIAVNSNNGDVLLNDQLVDLVFKLTAGELPFSTSPSAGSGSVQDLAIDQANGDVYAVDAIQDKAYRQVGGVGAWVAFGLYPNNNPTAIAVNADSKDVWVSDITGEVYKSAGGVGAFTEIGTYPDSSPGSLDVDSTTGALWIIDTTSDVVYKLADGSTTYVATGAYPGGGGVIAVDSSNSDVWVLDNQNNRLYVLKHSECNFVIAAELANAPNFTSLAVDQSNGDLWALDIDAFDKGVYKSPGVAQGQAVWLPQGIWSAGQPGGIAVNGSNSDVWVIDLAGNDIYKKTSGSCSYVQIGTYTDFDPQFIAVNSSNSDVWITDHDGLGPFINKLTGGAGSYVQIGTYPGTQPGPIAVNPTNGEVWIADTIDDVIYKLVGTTYTAIGTYPGTAPNGITVDPVTGHVWIGDADANIVYRLIGTTYTAVGTYPGGGIQDIQINEVNSDIWVLDGFDGTVYKLPGGTTVYNLQPVPQSIETPGGIAVDYGTGAVYLSNSGDDEEILKLS
ncbi:MAG: DUF2612 domain-containing protein [Alphaproteobacteria bacterium]|nr:DUF2612 domain-containing protein [Alphaproteobacteria bacterium]